MCNTDGSEVKRISDIKSTNIVILLTEAQKPILDKLVMKSGNSILLSFSLERLKQKTQTSRKELNQTSDDCRHVMKSAMTNWYGNNFDSWKYKSQQIISGDNIRAYMKMYGIGKPSPKQASQSPQKENGSFVYDNDEYKAFTVHKYGKLEPPAQKSPVKEDLHKIEEHDFARDSEISFFQTQSNYNNQMTSIRKKKQFLRI